MKLSPADKLGLYARAGLNALGLLGRATHPPAVIWVLTQRCFYRCIHCDSWMDRRPIDVGALRAIAERIVEAQTRIVALSGGEPFVVRTLPEIAARLKRAGKLVTINTNGHRLADHVDWLADERVDHVQVSIDGHDAALHDRIRARPGSYDRILAGIAALQARRRDGVPRISVCGVVMPENAAHVTAFVDRFAAVADAVELQPLHDSPGLLATSREGGFSAAERATVDAQMAAVAARHRAFANGYYRGFSRFLFDAASLRHAAVDHCMPMIFSTLTIREDGACRICRYPLDARVPECSLAEVWKSPARWALYAALARAGCGEPCWTRCHVHPSPLPGRVLRAAVRAATSTG